MHSNFYVFVCRHWFVLVLTVAVLGALIGKQKGRNLEIMNSFELMFHTIDNAVIVDREYYTTKEDQCGWS